jgi:hypothetical protein
VAAALPEPTATLGPEPGAAESRSTWLFSPRLDLVAFALPVAVACALVVVGRSLGYAAAPALPTWLFVTCIVGVDVAHVHATLFRVYLDAREVGRRPWLYLGTPPLVYGAGVALHLGLGGAAFWRLLAYAAVWHFVRQQAGWVALYQGREARQARGGPTRLDAWIDRAAIYLASLYPLLDWHTRAPRPFSWFLAGDFAVGLPRWVATGARVAWAAALVAFVLRQLVRLRAREVVSAGKTLVVLGTAATWWLGIVACDDDFSFTVTNVLPHGVPYLVLLLVYAGRRFAQGEPGPARLARTLLRFGFVSGYAALFALAFVEEAGWDRFVWHDHERLFGHARALSDEALGWLVPLLALPQAVHYVLDGFVWRRAENPDLGRYLSAPRAR